MADSAQGIIQTVLERYGLGSLAAWAWGRYQGGDSIEEILLEMRQRPEYKIRFPAMEQLAKEGRGLSEDQYMQYEQGLRQLTQTFGLPASTYASPDYVATLMLSNVSLAEAQSRMEIARAATTTIPQEYRDALTRLYGISESQLTAYWLDPDRALPMLEKQFAAAQFAGEARVSSLGDLSQTVAERMAEAGITREQARQGFAGAAQFAARLPGEAGEALGADRVALGVAGLGEERGALERLARQRRASFQGGGGAAATQQGAVGLVTTTRR